jgi:arylesterase/paraoxonase
MAVNRRGPDDRSIDIFVLATTVTQGGTVAAVLRERTSVRSSLFARARDVAAAGADRFYVSNAPRPAMDFAALLGAIFAPDKGEIVYFDGRLPRVVASNVPYANGLSLSDDGTKLYVTTTLSRSIRTYDVGRLSGSLVLQNTYSLPAALDHVAVDAQGALWVAGQPQLFALDGYARDARRPSPSQIFRVATQGQMPKTFTRSYTGLGSRIGAASVAVFAGGRLLLGSRLDDRLLICTPK